MRVLTGLLALLLVACEPAPSPETAPELDVRAPGSEALEALLVQEQTDRLRRVAASSRVFADAVEGLLGDPVDERLQTAREGWSQLYRSFNEAVVVLACRAATSPELAQALQRVDLFPIMPGYIDGLADWPDSGIVNDVSLPLSRESLLAQQGGTAQEEISLGFQVVAFLLYGEPAQPRTVADLTTVTEVAEDNPLSVEEQPQNRRREYLAIATRVLVDDLLALSAQPEAVMPLGAACPVDALRRTTERLIRVSGLRDREAVGGEYFAGHSRAIALAGLGQALQPWLEEASPLRPWLAGAGVQSALPVWPAAAPEPDILLLQQLHAGLSAARSALP